MMKTTLNIPESLLQEAVRLVGARTKTETVRLALEDLVRQKRLERVVARAGTLRFSDDWDKVRHAR